MYHGRQRLPDIALPFVLGTIYRPAHRCITSMLWTLHLLPWAIQDRPYLHLSAWRSSVFQSYSAGLGWIGSGQDTTRRVSLGGAGRSEEDAPEEVLGPKVFSSPSSHHSTIGPRAGVAGALALGLRWCRWSSQALALSAGHRRPSQAIAELSSSRAVAGHRALAGCYSATTIIKATTIPLTSRRRQTRTERKPELSATVETD
ncbi:hypothetical protein LXA43DRAFT_102044 [Ganoderma leucocontextum]|nr:hypothetical protein LXA43DRAFT_102044 [Ganoderma leucocontextum]